MEEEKKERKLTKIEKLIMPHSFQPEFKECLANIERKYGFELFDISGIGKQLDANNFAKKYFSTQSNVADVSVDSNSNVSLKSIICYDEEMSKPLKLILSYYRMWKGLRKKYGREYADKAVEKQLSGEIYINDFQGFSTNKYYSYYGKTALIVRYKGQILTTNMEYLFDKFKENVQVYPDKETVDLKNVNIQILDKGNKFINLQYILRHKSHCGLLKFETKNGYTTIVTEDHPVILDDNSEKVASDIQLGDRIKLSDCKLSIYDSMSKTINKEKYIIGFAIGDGCLITGGKTSEMGQMSIAQKELAEHKVYKYICEESPNTANTLKLKIGRVSSVVFGDKCWTCKNAHIKKGAQNKILPEDIWNWDRNEVLSLIAGLIDSDGCVNPQNGFVDIRICSFTAVQQIAELLRSMGFKRIRTAISNRQKREGSFGSNFDMYRVSFVADDPELISYSCKLTDKKELVTKERGIDGRYETNEVLKIMPFEQEYVYDVTTETGHFHSQGLIQHNCYNYSTLDTAMNGIPKGIDAESSTPTKYLNTFFEHLQLFCVHAGSSSLGAVGLADLLITISCYVDRILQTHSDQHTPLGDGGKIWEDIQNIVGSDFGNVSDAKMALIKNILNNTTKEEIKFNSDKACWTFIKEKLTNFVYFLNQPNRVTQSLFTNVSIYDDNFIDTMLEHYFIEDEDGNIYKAKKENIKKLQWLLIDIMNETLNRRLITFPVVTACFSLDEQRNVLEESFLAEVLKRNRKYCYINLYGGSTSTLSSCCFDKNQKVLVKDTKRGVVLQSLKELYETPWVERPNLRAFNNGFWSLAKPIKVLKEDKKMYKIRTIKNQEFTCTEDHNLLTYRGELPAKELDINDYLMVNTLTLPKISERDLGLTFSEGVLIGAYLGDGNIYHRKENNGCELTLSLNKNKIENLQKYIEKAIKKINPEQSIRINESKNNVVFLKASGTSVVNFIEQWCDCEHAENKNLNLDALMQSEEFRRGILYGLHKTDGHNEYNILYTTSEKLKDSIEALVISLGGICNIKADDRTNESVIIRGAVYKRNFPVYHIRFLFNRSKSIEDVLKVKNSSLYIKIASIEEVKDYNEKYVYCLEMKDAEDHYFTLPNGIHLSNCRLRSDKKNKYFNTLGSGGTKIGSLSVCTQNLPRLAFMSENNLDKFKELLEENITLSQRINHTKRIAIKKAIDKKMIPLYNLNYTLLNTQYSTTGVVGIYEALEILGYDITSEEGIETAKELLQFMNKINDKVAEELNVPVNMEQIPAENVAVKLAKKDRLLGYNKEYDIYSNQYIPLKRQDVDLFTRVRLVAELDGEMSGGSILHININEDVADERTFLDLAKTMFKQGVIYFAFNKLLAICNEEDCGKVFTTDKETFDNNDVTCPVCGSKNTECALRIVGFIRKFSSWSSERQAEGKARKFYKSLIKGQ